MENRSRFPEILISLLSLLLSALALFITVCFQRDIAVFGREFTGYSVVFAVFASIIVIFIIVILLLWLFARQGTALFLLEIVSAYKPILYKCSVHERKMKYALEFIRLLFRNNYSYAWLLPSLDDRTARGTGRDFVDDYFALQLKEWSAILTRKIRTADIALPNDDKNGRGAAKKTAVEKASPYLPVSDDVPPIIENSEYVFITWDLTELAQWTPNVVRFWLKNLDPMLTDLKERCKAKRLHVDRILILPEGILADNYQVDSKSAFYNFMDIWYMIGACEAGNHYRIRFISDQDLAHAADDVDKKGAKDYKEDFKDVAFFNKTVLVLSNDKLEPLFPPSEDCTSIPEYMCLQWSRRHGRNSKAALVELYLVIGTSLKDKGKSLGEEKGDKFIGKKRRRVKMVLNHLPAAEREAAKKREHKRGTVFHDAFVQKYKSDLQEFTQLTWKVTEEVQS